ncbi:hypothetical protein [Pollutibacter soli]|uniref:hypothetical protein n=1 Tax=Pollutibacter soli TaxID=3034157 RepID=UPI003013D3D9
MLFNEFISGLANIIQAGEDNNDLTAIPNYTTFLAPSFNLINNTDKDHLREILKAIAACWEMCKDAPFTEARLLKPDFFKTTPTIPAPPVNEYICGPLLRKVDETSASVWIALPKSDKVICSVFENNGGNAGDKIMEGTANTLPFGPKLHIALVTAKILSGKKANYGDTYLYDLKFNLHKNLNAFTGNEFTYSGHQLPSFVMPPLDLNKLHIIHGSCRNMSSDALDNLPGINTLIKDNFSGRPHQMFLSGDQIYADESNEILEHVTIEVGNALMPAAANAEKIILKDGETTTVDPSKVKPGERGINTSTRPFIVDSIPYNFPELVRKFVNGETPETRDFIHDFCGFTPTSRFHLFSLADYFSTYLMNWTDVIWPIYFKSDAIIQWATKLTILHKQGEGSGIPSGSKSLLTELKSAISKVSDIAKDYELGLKKLKTKNTEFDTQLKTLLGFKKFLQILNSLCDFVSTVVFVSNLKDLRRAMANIPTYMIFDDHEVTDDWHMTREWVRRAYSFPMGRRVMQNGLASFAVFQAWGNTPEKFNLSDSTSSGTKLLNAVSAWINKNYNDQAQEKIIANLLKIPFGSQVAKYKQITPGDTFPDIYDKPLEWHFTYRHPKYEVIVMDARTFRSFPGSFYGPADHVSEKSITAQTDNPIKLAAPFDKDPPELTIVISPCNVLTIPMFRNYLSAVALPMAHYMMGFDGSRWKMTAYDPDQADSWEVASKLFETLLARLATRTFKNFPDKPRKSKVVILSGDVHFSFAGRVAYYAEKPLNTTETKQHDLVAAHLTSSGFRNEPGAWKLLQLDKLGYEFSDFGNSSLRLPEPDIMIGYAKKPAAFNKTKTDEVVTRTRWFPNFKPAMMIDTPLLLPAHKIHPDVSLPKPEWMYRLDFFRAINVKDVPNITDIKHFKLVTDQKPSTEILRRSSFAEISFDWEGEGKLIKAVNDKEKTLEVDTGAGKKFPPAPFYVTVENEIMYVTSATPVDNKITMTVTRGKSDSKKAAHIKDKIVKIRQGVTQTNWVHIEPSKKDTVQKLNVTPLNRFKVPLSSEDLQFPKPTVKTI